MFAWRTLAPILLALALPAAAQDRASSSVPLPPPPTTTAPNCAGGDGWRLAPVVAVGAWRDGAAGDTQPAVTGGLEGEWRGARHHAVLAGFQYGAYRRHVQTSPSGSVAVRENDLGLRLAYAYEFLHHWSASGRASGELLVGGFWRTFQNQAAPTTAIGPLGGLRLGYRFANPLDAGIETTYGFGASSTGSDCCTPGKPKGVVSTFASVGIRAAAARLRVGYRSEVVILEHDHRSFDGLALVLDLGL
jgi:hypothetical protein